MTDTDRSLDSLTELWRRRGIDSADLQLDQKGTITAPVRHEPVGPPAAMAPLDPHAYQLGRRLGEGGTGVVHMATQLALKRDVAVKTLRSDKRSDPAARDGLLREAWICGYLQHPNIVPIHTLWDDDGLPAVAMKRVEGASWHEVLHAPERHAELGIEDPLEWHLKTLITVCHAVHYAHSLGVLHRDLKPQNVMIGRFGEVYLVDWGLAVRYRDDAPQWIPLAREVTSVEGTPAYMAPEMAEGNGAAFDPRTDVYLLGATLHELITYEPLHDGETPLEMVRAAFRCKPARYPSTIPAELTQIAARATQADRAQRFPSAEALRRAVDAFLSHRSAVQLYDYADAQLRAAEAMTTGSDGVDEQLRACADDARVALHQADLLWPDSPRAHVLRQRLLRVLLDHALWRGLADEAAQHLQLLDDPGTAREQLAALRQSQADDRRLTAIGRATDVNQGLGMRAKLAAAVGLIWCVILIGFGMRFRAGLMSHGLMVATTLVAALVALVSLRVVGGLRAMHPVNRRQLLLFVSTNLSVTLSHLIGWVLGMDYAQTLALDGVVLLQFPTAIAVLHDRRFAWAVLTTAICVIGALFAPQWLHEWLAAALLLSGMVIFRVLGRSPGPVRRQRGDVSER